MTATGAAAVAVLFALLIAASAPADAAEGESAGDPAPDPAPDTNAGTWFENILDGIADTVKADDTNRAAFLAMIRRAETGTSGPDAYSILVGGARFSDFSRHPNVYHRGLNSTAAGAYQINYPTWSTEILPALKLPDFSPASQDAAALYLLRRSGALKAIDAGDFAAAVRLAAPRWASLPGAGYGQPERPLATLASWYAAEGGRIA